MTLPQSYGRFHTTRWSLVCSSGSADPAVAKRALGELCHAYWGPLYAFLRREGHDEHAAMDLVQGFLTRVLDKGDLAADAERGRFRSYLLGALKNFVRNQERDARAEKRGGGQPALSLDGDEAENRFRAEDIEGDTPERAFDRQFALALLDRSIEEVEQEYRGRGREAVFTRLMPFLTDRPGVGEYPKAAADLGLSETAVKVTVHRMRGRLRTVLTEELLQTLDAASDLEQELSTLLAALEK